MGNKNDTLSGLNELRDKVKHVFVLMLENHSFDNIFGNSGIPGIVAANSSSRNSYQGKTYQFQGPAPDAMPTDPGHEFLDVVQQLTGSIFGVHSKTAGHPYPPINNSGFVANYATSKTEKTGLPNHKEIGDIMKGFHTPSQLPVIHHLATEFAICDHWFSSLPGPTWPNRFFVHGASSSGLDDSPSGEQIGWWKTHSSGFKFENGSIFDKLGHGNYKLYSGGLRWLAQVSSIHGIPNASVEPISHFFAEIKKRDYPSQYTFIEPDYGNMFNNTYRGGSSQHPMDGMAGGEKLIKEVYEAIRKSPVWESSLLIITYDEHGGFYDSVKPPKAVPPGDNPNYGLNKHGFQFDQYGPRVPAVVISPYIPRGTVDHTVYDHASVPATLERLFGKTPMTNRDKNANDVLRLLALKDPRMDCPRDLVASKPVDDAAAVPITSADLGSFFKQPLPESGNLIGFLQIMLKAQHERKSQDGSVENAQQPDALEADFEARLKTAKTIGDLMGDHRDFLWMLE